MTRGVVPDAAARAELVLQVCRELRGSVPAPRGAPYFGLDLDIAFSPAVLESLSDPGIFRKYELVLLLGAPHGGVARWMATRLACRVVVADADTRALAFGAALNRRAHAHDSVSFLCGDTARLPVRPRGFTHVWCLGTPGDVTSTLRQAQIAVRPGGHFAVQLLPGDEAAADADLVAACAAAGFDGAAIVSVDTREPPTAFRLARQRIRAAAVARWGSSAAELWPDFAPMPARLRRLHARRPP
jgi:hypothetical protein